LDALQAEAGNDFIITPTEFYDKEGILKTGEELFTELDKLAGGTSGAWKDKYISTPDITKITDNYYKGGVEQIDFSSMTKDLTAHGFTENEQMKIGNEML
jgi:hypothetical protein